MLVGERPAKGLGALRAHLADGATSSKLQQAECSLEALRLLLTGASVIDIGKMWLATDEQVDRFLRVSGFDTDSPLDIGRLWELHSEATTYLTEIHGYTLPHEVMHPDRIHDVFLLAANGAARQRRGACMALKVMHIFHHVAGRELVFNTDISEAQLFDRLNAKVFTVIDRMRAAGISVPEFSAGKKSRHSQVTKLLAKRGNLASHIFDKLRFRLIVGSKDDLVRALIYLVDHLFPFNYVVPEQSHNGLIAASDVARVLGLSVEQVEKSWSQSAHDDHSRPPQVGAGNEFSGPTYRSVNFVAEIPLRVDDVAPLSSPAVVFVQAEIQVIDSATDKLNNEGENSHRLYKERQRARVRSRLEGCPDSSCALQATADQRA